MDRISALAMEEPDVRAIWQLAHMYAVRHVEERVREDAPAVIELRDLLVHAFETGAKRTIGQARQVDDALAQHHVAIPAGTLILSPLRERVATQLRIDLIGRGHACIGPDGERFDPMLVMLHGDGTYMAVPDPSTDTDTDEASPCRPYGESTNDDRDRLMAWFVAMGPHWSPSKAIARTFRCTTRTAKNKLRNDILALNHAGQIEKRSGVGVDGLLESSFRRAPRPNKE